MIIKSTVQTLIDKDLAVSVSTESIVETIEEARDFGGQSALMSQAFISGFGEADLDD